MANYENEEEAPLDPAAERLRRKLIRLLLGSGLIMLLGLIAVFAAIVYKTGLLGGPEARRTAQLASGAAGERAEAIVEVPSGARLVTADLQGGNALLTLQTEEGATALILIDLASGAVLGRYVLRER